MSKTERVALLAELTGIGKLLRRLGGWHGVLTLTYHRVVGFENVYNPAIIDASPHTFEEQMRFLVRNFDVVTPEDLETVLALRRGRYVLVTLDDGYRDNFEVAFPILEKHGVPATFFITTGFLDDHMIPMWDEIAWMVHRTTGGELPANEWLDRPLSLHPADHERTIATLISICERLPHSPEGVLDSLATLTGSGRHDHPHDTWMTWDQVRQLRAAGMTIGGHTISHPVLARLPADEQEQEIAGCKRRIETELAEPMRYFSYPYGGRASFDDTTRRVVAETGLEFAFSLYNGYCRLDSWDRYDIKRRGLGPTVTPNRVALMLTLPQVFAGGASVVRAGDGAGAATTYSPA
jgi:peptidoglycan/xylan/chitin deacetylase (PgdA/CDA1 family)